MKASELEASRGRFRKGRAKTGGRRRGTPNKTTRAWKDFVAELVNDPEQQQALANAIKAHPSCSSRRQSTPWASPIRTPLRPGS